MRMLGAVGVGALFPLLRVGGGWAVAADAPALPPTITVRGGHLSVHLTKAPLAQVLELILERGAARITVFGEAVGEITDQFDDLPLHQGLRRLLAPRSFVLVYMEEGAEPLEAGRLKVMAVASSQADAMDREVGHDKPAPPRVLVGTPPPDEDLLAAVGAGGSGATVAERTRFLKEAVESAPDADVRSVALKSLTQISPVPLDAIAQVALADRSPRIRSRAIALLADHGQLDGLVMETLLTVARTDPDTGVREQASVLAKILAPALPGGGNP